MYFLFGFLSKGTPKRSPLQDFNTKYMAATMAVILIIGPYFSGHLRPEATLLGRASMLSNMRYHTAVIISLFSACGSLAASSRKLMKLTAYAERLQQLELVAKEISSGVAGRISFIQLYVNDSIDACNLPPQ